MSFLVREVDWCTPILHLKINVTVCCNELIRDGLMSVTGHYVERSDPMLVLVVDE